jgi:hypothetical protein
MSATLSTRIQQLAVDRLFSNRLTSRFSTCQTLDVSLINPVTISIINTIMKKYYVFLLAAIGGIGIASPSFAQINLSSTQPTTIGNTSSGNVIDNRPVQNANVINIPSTTISPLQNSLITPVNTENDFGLSASVGLNTLDSSNVTVFLGISFQPGRTNDHNTRMAKIRKETEVLESNRKLAQSQLTLLEQQIAESKIRLQQLQPTPLKPSPR